MRMKSCWTKSFPDTLEEALAEFDPDVKLKLNGMLTWKWLVLSNTLNVG